MSFKEGHIFDTVFFSSFYGGNTFQNLKVSSPAPVTKVCPQGDTDKYKTLKVWPVSRASFFMEGYFQIII